MYVRRLRNEQGGILVLAAVILPVFLLMCALVVDAGNWFTHKRQLQNRADAGALAAGVEYLSQLANCQANPSGAGTSIAAAAKKYAGDPATAGTKYNQEITNDDDLVVAINRANVSDASDGNPCVAHADADSLSPKGGIWTDVKVRESNIGTLFRTFGINLPSITAQARVEVKQITGLTHGGLPFVHETGDYVDCVWAEFVDAKDGTRVSLVGNSNPVSLTLDPNTPRRWTADVGGITLPGSKTAVAVHYWMGTSTNGSCDFSGTTLKSRFAGTGPLNKFGEPAAVVPIDWINVFDDDTPGGSSPPLLHHFNLLPGSCGTDRVGYIYSTSACTIGFSAEVDHGSNPAPSSITVSSSNGWCTAPSPCVSPVTATPSSSSGTKTTYTGQITYNPAAVSGDTTVSQDYTQVGQQKITASWTMTSGSLTSGTIDDGSKNGKNCTTSKPCNCATTPCKATFETDVPGNVVHATYVADPVTSSPLYYAELLSGSTPIANSIAADGGPVGPFKVVLTNTGIDQDHIVMLRGSVQGTGNLTLAVKCGWSSNSAEELQDAVIGGCPASMKVNQRGDSCANAPNFSVNNGWWDCVEAVPGNKTGKVASGAHVRFASPCTTNYWINGSSPENLLPNDPRFAYIFLTSFGRVTNDSAWYPIKAFLRVYVTGGDGMGCPGDDPHPRGYSGKGAELWGHLVDLVTLSDDVVAGDQVCDSKVAAISCKPELVR
jgi:Flp pilus assembly protein TadG